MEHLIIRGGNNYLPLARKLIDRLKSLGLDYASQTFVFNGVKLRIRIEPGHDHIHLEGEEVFYEFFTPDLHDAWSWDTPGSITSYTPARKNGCNLVYSQSITKPKTRNPVAGIKTPLCKTWAAYNGQRLPEYIHWTLAAPGSTGSRVSIQGWTASTLIGHCTQHPWMFDAARWSTSLRPAEDVGLDIAPAYHAPGAAPVRKVPSSFNAVADNNATSPATIQSRLYYGRACVQRVVSDEFGSRDFFILTDSHSNFYVYPVGDDGTDTPVMDGAVVMFGITYSNNFVKLEAPLPVWAARASESTQIASYGRAELFPNYTERIDRRIELTPPDPTEPALYNLYRYKWAFDSRGERAVAVVATVPVPDPTGAQRIPGYTMGIVVAQYQVDPPNIPLAVREISFPGIVELRVNIVLTGSDLSDFSASLEVTREFNSLATGEYYLAADYAFGDNRLKSLGVNRDDLVNASIRIGFSRYFGSYITRTHVNIGVTGENPAFSILVRDSHTADSSPSVRYVDTLVFRGGVRLGKAQLALPAYFSSKPIPGVKRYEGAQVHSLDLRSMSAILELRRDVVPFDQITLTDGNMFHYGSCVISYGQIRNVDSGFVAGDFFNVPPSAYTHPFGPTSYYGASQPMRFGDYAAEAAALGMAAGDQYAAGTRGVINTHPSGNIAFHRAPTWYIYSSGIPGIMNSWVDSIDVVKKNSGGDVVNIKSTTHIDCFNIGKDVPNAAYRNYDYYDSIPWDQQKYGSFCSMGVWSTSPIKYNLPGDWSAT